MDNERKELDNGRESNNNERKERKERRDNGKELRRGLGKRGVREEGKGIGKIEEKLVTMKGGKRRGEEKIKVKSKGKRERWRYRGE